MERGVRDPPRNCSKITRRISPGFSFFGDNFINGVRPKKKPNMYAITSFITIILTGTMNLKTINIINKLSTYTYLFYMHNNFDR